MRLSRWLRPYLEAELAGVEGVTYRDDSLRRVTITFPGNAPGEPEETIITIVLGNKVYGDLLKDIESGDQKNQDLVGNHFASKIAEGRAEFPRSGLKDLTIDLHLN